MRGVVSDNLSLQRIFKDGGPPRLRREALHAFNLKFALLVALASNCLVPMSLRIMGRSKVVSRDYLWSAVKLFGKIVSRRY